MSILDSEINNSNLQLSLIPLPDIFENKLDDIYFVGETPIERWNSFIDPIHTSLLDKHQHLIKQRNYHIKIITEVVTLLSFTDNSWMSTPNFVVVRDIAYLELRVVEFQILAFQLTTNQIGLKTNDRRAMYETALHLQTTLLWLVNEMIPVKSKHQKKLYAEIIREGPCASDSVSELGKNIDKLIFAVQEMLKRSGLFTEKAGKDMKFVNGISDKLKASILSFEKIAIILEIL